MNNQLSLIVLNNDLKTCLSMTPTLNLRMLLCFLNWDSSIIQGNILFFYLIPFQGTWADRIEHMC